MLVSDLRALIAGAPDDAPVRVNLEHVDGSARAVLDGEYLPPEQWGDEAGIFLQVQRRCTRHLSAQHMADECGDTPGGPTL